MAAYTELTIEQGATFSTKVNVEDIYGSAINLASYTTDSMMRKSYYSNTSYTITSTISNAANGEITLSMSAANSALLTSGRYVYDVIIEDTSNTVTRVIEGIVTVLPSVTR